jgi:hypothetical protein
MMAKTMLMALTMMTGRDAVAVLGSVGRLTLESDCLVEFESAAFGAAVA